MAKFLQQNLEKIKKFENVRVSIAKALIIATEYYDRFLLLNNLENYSEVQCKDEETAARFLSSKLPESLVYNLRIYLTETTQPIAIRSSSLLEDSKDQPYAGLYDTFMLANNHPDIGVRLEQLCTAIKYVYASVFYESPKAFSRTTQHRTEEEKMGILIQPITGRQHGDYFYPAISGTAQSYNFYPVSHMNADDGIAHISLGLGKIVVEGGQSLRFSPNHPQSLPQFSAVNDILKNAQQYFYAVKMNSESTKLTNDQDSTLIRREIIDAVSEEPVRLLSSTYSPNDHRIRDMFSKNGSPVLTFANILKYDRIPLASLLSELLHIARKGFGCDIELEFAVDLSPDPEGVSDFVLLQARPMTTPYESIGVEIEKEDIERAVCYSTSTLGFGNNMLDTIDIIFVKPETVSSKTTVQIASEISKFNAEFIKEDGKYLLIGPGRWGSSDHCLGIPVSWRDISNVSAIIETHAENFKADPSEGTHFFQNMTSQRIIYFTVHKESDFVKWDWLKSQPIVKETEYICHVRTVNPLSVKINGKKNHGVLFCS